LRPTPEMIQSQTRPRTVQIGRPAEKCERIARRPARPERSQIPRFCACDTRVAAWWPAAELRLSHGTRRSSQWVSFGGSAYGRSRIIGCCRRRQHPRRRVYRPDHASRGDPRHGLPNRLQRPRRVWTRPGENESPERSSTTLGFSRVRHDVGVVRQLTSAHLGLDDADTGRTSGHAVPMSHSQRSGVKAGHTTKMNYAFCAAGSLVESPTPPIHDGVRALAAYVDVSSCARKSGESCESVKL
jgi:hypothetical protein